MRVGLFSQVTKEEMVLGCAKGGLAWILGKKFHHHKGYQALEQADQGSGGVINPKGI